MTTSTRPKATSFWSAYLNYNEYTSTDAWAKVGPWLSNKYGHENSCAARVSYGLNYGGAPIPNSPVHQTNLNDDKYRYIISAAKLDAYLKDSWGTPAFTFPGTGGKTIMELRKHLGRGKVAIVAYAGHSGVVTQTYNDPYTPYSTQVGNVWILDL